MKAKIISVVLAASAVLTATPAASAALEINTKTAAVSAVHDMRAAVRAASKALEQTALGRAAKGCLLKPGLGSALALSIGPHGMKTARDIIDNTVLAGAAACRSQIGR
ncbi:hypothetical protein [Streptomyces sp. NRRL B-1347]|uniref:hypothetical protein n=1 Tax=Streptomyces sp. NRRL B-1347 TaxID=1476877 RepID=UPI0004CB24F9|nr:hypothetical protein [Streptomyces sp. NRRL B-1347]